MVLYIIFNSSPPRSKTFKTFKRLMELPSVEELTTIIARLNYEAMKAQSEVTACRTAIRGYLASKGEPEDKLDEIISKGSATILDLKLSQAEKLSPCAAAAIDKRTDEEMSLVDIEALEEMRMRQD